MGKGRMGWRVTCGDRQFVGTDEMMAAHMGLLMQDATRLQTALDAAQALAERRRLTITEATRASLAAQRLALMRRKERDELKAEVALQMVIIRKAAKREKETQEAKSDLEAEVSRLTGIVDRLPKTADGVTVLPHDTVFDVYGDSLMVLHITEGCCQDDWLQKYPNMPIPEYVAFWSKVCHSIDGDDWEGGVLALSDCYSTHEAAEAARGGDKS